MMGKGLFVFFGHPAGGLPDRGCRYGTRHVNDFQVKTNMYKLHSLLLAAVITLPGVACAEDFRVSSPNGRITATVTLDEGKLSYTVHKDGRLLVAPSPLGLKTSNVDLTRELSLESSRTVEIDTPYSLPVGKQSQYRDHCHMLSVLTKKSSLKQTVQFRLYDDGFAFRYVIPEVKSLTNVVLTEEASRIRMADFSNSLACKFIGNIQSPNYPYEGHYDLYTNWNSLLQAGDRRFNAPLLASDGKDYLLLSEADNRGIFCASLVKAENREGEFSFAWTGAVKDYAKDKMQSMNCKLPVYTPWRMVVAGDLAAVFETTMTENLCPPTVIDDMSWIKPGVSAWYWGGSDGNKTDIQKVYGGIREGEYDHADFAAEMGWPYTLIDGGWSAEWVPSLVKHAQEKGVECLLWQTAKLSDSQDFSNGNMEKTLKQWADWGIKGIKIDFWEDDSHETMIRMENLLKLCGKYQMLVNLHGCTRPSGLRRTYPYLMTQEGICGGETNFWWPSNITGAHHINMMFTRNVVGAADYTPGDFASFLGSIITQVSMGQHMALMTAFESGITHIAECPENLRHFLGKDIMKRLPTAWDESRLLEGKLLKYATIARRSGEDWWVSGLCTDARNCKLTFDFLEEGRTYTAYIYRDGNCRSDLKFNKVQVKKGSSLNIRELSEGGFLVQVSPRADLDSPVERVTYEAESTVNTLTGDARRDTYSPLHASAGGYVTYVGKGSMLQFNNVVADHDGDYMLTIYYITQDKRNAKLLVNGEVLCDPLVFNGNDDMTHTYSPEGMGWKMVPVRLKAGRNTITLQSYADGWAPNFDRITLHPLTAPTPDGVGSVAPAVKVEAGAIYDLTGMRLSSVPDRGIYVRGGKKYCAKGRG